jgi:hypothetical protein
LVTRVVSIELDMLLSEDVASAKARAENAFRDFAGDRPVVLVGDGDLARRVAAELERLQRPLAAFAALSDMGDAIARHADAVFVVCPARDAMAMRLSACYAAGAARVTSFALFAWSHPERLLPYGPIDLPHHVLEQKEDARRAFDGLADDRSRQRYVAEIRFRLHLDFAGVGMVEAGPLPSGASPVPIVQQSDLWRVPLALGPPVLLCTQEGALFAMAAPAG